MPVNWRIQTLDGYNSDMSRGGSPAVLDMQDAVGAVGGNRKIWFDHHQPWFQRAQKEFAKNMLEKLRAPATDSTHVSPHAVSLKEVFYAMHPWIDDNSDIAQVTEAISHSDFPIITSNLVSPQAIEGYEYALADAMSLVRDMGDAKQADEIVPGVTAGLEMSAVRELEVFPDDTRGEKSVRILTRKIGKIVPISWELIRFDNTGIILDRCRDVGDNMGVTFHRWIIQKITDVAVDITGEAASTSFRYESGGSWSGAAVYQNDHSAIDGQTNDNLLASNPFSHNGLHAAITALRTQKDERGTEITTRGRVLLVPEALSGKAQNVLLSPTDWDTANRAANTLLARLGTRPTIFVSQMLDGQSATTWYWGDPNRQYGWKWTRRPEVLSMGTNSDRALDQDIVQRIRISAGGGCGALDYRHMVKSTA